VNSDGNYLEILNSWIGFKLNSN